MVGALKYRHCTFVNSTPVLLEPSYNAYTPFDIFIEKCVLKISDGKNYLTYSRKTVKGDNDRMELQEINWPNLYIKDSQIIGADNVNNYFLYYNDHSAYSKPIKGTVNIVMEGLKLSSNNTDHKFRIKIYSQPVSFQNKIAMRIKNISKNIFVEN